MTLRSASLLSIRGIAAASLVALVFAATAYAETWYLMAADEKVISEGKAAATMSKGSVVGPLRFTSRGEFSNRSECETDRHKLLTDWQRHSLMARGGWSRRGFTTPNAFAQCLSESDPRLVKTPGAAPSAELTLRVPKRR
jgi:hypothetical protein